jgi:hypothetical protein
MPTEGPPYRLVPTMFLLTSKTRFEHKTRSWLKLSVDVTDSVYSSRAWSGHGFGGTSDFAANLVAHDAPARNKKSNRGVAHRTALATLLNLFPKYVTHSQSTSRSSRRARENRTRPIERHRRQRHQHGYAYRFATLPEHQRRLLRRMNTPTLPHDKSPTEIKLL